VGDVVKTINGDTVESATFGCALLASAPAGFIEVVVVTTVVQARPASPKELIEMQMLPTKSAFDDEIEVLPMKKDVAAAVPTFDTQVAELYDMGFVDETAARHALRACNGNVQCAVERLLAAS